MPAGLPYFAWINAGETVFGSEHMRWDESIFSFSLEQSEGDPASLTVTVRRPRNVDGDPIGLLGPGRKIWAWFALDCGPALFRFRGRLVGVPTSLFEDLVTLEFVARPFNVVEQKEALAATLRVLPYYDEVVLDPARRTDPEVVLEGYSKVWHYNRETHVLTVSDEIAGEDGLVEFDGASEGGKTLWDGLSLSLSSGPLSRIDVSAEFTWTQQAHGNVDLTQYLTENWPNEPGMAQPGNITSFTFSASDWPKSGAGLGDGWTVAESTSLEVYDLTVKTVTGGNSITVDWWDGGSTTVTTSFSESGLLLAPPGSIGYPGIITASSSSVEYVNLPEGGSVLTSFSSSSTVTSSVLPLHHSRPAMWASYAAGRQCTEKVLVSLLADVQPVLTDPSDGEALRIDDVRSVNLSEAIGGVVPIGDPRRRSYIATERGNRSVEHLIALARAHLLKRARVVEIGFAPKLSRMPEVTLRKNAFFADPRAGEALGKIIGYRIALDGADGRIDCQIRIGCAIGRGGSAVASGGEPTYCSEAYTGADYQQFTGRTVLFDTSVGYQPPNASPNDDGINFLSTLRAEDVIETPLVVENPPAAQRAYLEDRSSWNTHFFSSGRFQTDERQSLVSARSDDIQNILEGVETRATFKLKSMTREFSTDYQIQTTYLQIPAGYDLEAV